MRSFKKNLPPVISVRHNYGVNVTSVSSSVFKIPACLVILALAMLLPASLAAQADPSQMASSQLLERVNEFASEGRFVEGRGHFEEMRDRFSDGTESEQAAILPLYYFLGLSYLQEYGRTGDRALLEPAVENFTIYIDGSPDAQFTVDALRYRVDSFRGLGRFAEAAEDLERLLNPPLSRRINARQRMEAIEKISEAYYVLRDWDRGIPYFRLFLDSAVDPDKRADAATALIEAFIDLGNISEIVDLLPAILVESPARYNVSLNVALMEAGDRLTDENRFSEAALLYNVTLSLEQIRNYFTNRRESLQAQLERLRSLRADEDRQSLIEVQIENATAELERLADVPSYSAELKVRQARNFFLASRDFEAFWAYYRLAEEYPEHESVRDFEFAAFMTAMRAGLDEQMQAIGRRFLEGPDAEEFRRDILYGMADSYLQAGNMEEFLAAAGNLIDEFPEDRYSAQMLFLVGNHFLTEQMMEELVAEFEGYREQLAGTDNMDAVLYWLGLGKLFQQDFLGARDVFAELVANHEGSIYFADARYRYAITYYGANEIDEARSVFSAFIADFPEHQLRGEVEYFLGEIEASAGGDLRRAVDHYESVERFTPNQSYVNAAYQQMSSLFHRNEMFNRLETLWRRYIDNHGDQGDLPMAIYELGRAQRLLGRPGDMINSYREAIFQFGNNPSNDGVDRILDEYVERYYESLERLEATRGLLVQLLEDEDFRREMVTNRAFLFQFFVDNPAVEPSLYEEFRNRDELGEALMNDLSPVESMLAAYEKQLEVFPSETPQEAFKAELAEARTRGDRTLYFRLLMALDQLGERPEVPTILDRDLRVMSPSTLVWVAERELEADPDLALRAIDRIMSEYEDSPSILPALMLQAEVARNEGNLGRAQRLYKEAEERFPAHESIYRAVIGQGEVLVEQGEFDQARSMLQNVLRVSEWRGEAHAHALFVIGTSYYREAEGLSGEERERRLLNAHGFFERTFVMYSYFKEWAGKAYVMDTRTLIALGQMDDARRTLDELLANDEFRDQEAFREAQQLRPTL